MKIRARRAHTRGGADSVRPSVIFFSRQSEASDGTLRFVTNLPCGSVPVIALEVRRTTGSR